MSHCNKTVLKDDVRIKHCDTRERVVEHEFGIKIQIRMVVSAKIFPRNSVDVTCNYSRLIKNLLSKAKDKN